jgi:hypothetical protein
MQRLDQNMQELLSNYSSSAVDITSNSHSSTQNAGVNSNTSNKDMMLEACCANGEKIAIELAGCSTFEIEFMNKIKILLQGEEIYKKFGTSSSMTSKPFDPLEPNVTPE